MTRARRPLPAEVEPAMPADRFRRRRKPRPRPDVDRTLLRRHLYLLHLSARTASSTTRARRVITAMLAERPAYQPRRPVRQGDFCWPDGLTEADGVSALKPRLRSMLGCLTRLRLVRDADRYEIERWEVRVAEIGQDLHALLDHLPALRPLVPGLLRDLSPGVMDVVVREIGRRAEATWEVVPRRRRASPSVPISVAQKRLHGVQEGRN